MKCNTDIGLLLLRLFTGVRLVYGVQDNVLSRQHMYAFRDFLAANNFPFPLACAYLSVFAQLTAGLLLIVGWQVRLAAFIMCLNFLVAILMVHRADSFEGMTPAMALFFINLLFLFSGGGRYALDKRLGRRGEYN
ncbi:MAG TPA: DoxX family protein [Flavisolibacter sp.]|nr:DoxX family protein [Flavisolibacter sp.]